MRKLRRNFSFELKFASHHNNDDYVNQEAAFLRFSGSLGLSDFSEKVCFNCCFIQALRTVNFMGEEGGGAAWHRGSVGASHPAAPGLYLHCTEVFQMIF